MDQHLLQQLAKNYQIDILSFWTIHDTDHSHVVVIQSGQGNFILKCIYEDQERMRFIVEAETYLRQKGIPIPEIASTTNKHPYFIWNGYPYTLHQYVGGKPIQLSSDKALDQRAAMIGRIHTRSVGFQSYFGHRYNSAERWEEQYEAELESLEEWSYTHRSPKKEKRIALQNALDYFLTIGNETREKLASFAHFSQWKCQSLQKHFLCHGDFHIGNVLVQKNTFHIIDWKYVRYDFPSIDLAQLLNSVMRTDDGWNRNRFETILTGYMRENPLSPSQLGLLYLDLAFPHQLERFLRNKWYEQMSVEQVDAFLQREQKKTRYMLKQLHSYYG